MSEAGKGRTITPEWRENLSKAGKGRRFSEEHKEKIRQTQLGEQNSFYGRKHTDEAKAKMAENAAKVSRRLWDNDDGSFRRKAAENCRKAQLISCSFPISEKVLERMRTNNPMNDPDIRERQRQNVPNGEDHYRWNPDRDAVFRPYTERFFDAEYRQELLERQDGFCPVCGKQEPDMIHHVDFDKSNDAPGNLVWVHRSCHMYLKNSELAIWRMQTWMEELYSSAV